MNDLVIAFYKEKECINKFKKYIKKFKYNTIIYNKGGHKILDNSFNYKVINLPNIGLHSHSYIHHIVENYYNLSEVTIFILGSAFRDLKKAKKADWVLKNANKCKGFMASHIWLAKEEDYNFEMPYYDIFDYSNNSIKFDSKRTRTKMIRAEITPLGKWIESNTKQNFINKSFYRSSKCIFAVNKNLILKQPRSYYENFYNLLNKYKIDEINLEVIHFFERGWLNIFKQGYSTSDLEHDINKYGKIN